MDQASSSSDIVVPPPGNRFQPTNEELVNYYLKRKITGNHSDVNKHIVTIENINNYDPSELPRLCSKPRDDNIYWYFFCKWNSYGKGNRINRKTKTGSWKKTGKELDIKDLATKIVSGKRSIFSFNKSLTKSDATKTDYMMHVFEMINHSNQSEPYVLCRLHENTTKRKKSKFGTPNRVDFEMPIPRAVIPRVEGNVIGEQNNGAFSQSLDSAVLHGDGLRFDDTSNGNTPLPTTETQAEYGQRQEDHCEMQDSSGFPESEVSLEDMMEMFYVPRDGSNQVTTVDNEAVDGHGNFQVFPPENNHQWPFSLSPDSLFPHGGKVPEALTATQAFDDQAKLDLELQPVFSPDSDWPQLSCGEESPVFDFPSENLWGNLDSYSYANQQMTIASPHLPVHQRSGFLPNSS